MSLSQQIRLFAVMIAFSLGLTAQQPHHFDISGSTFQMDGKPFQVISGEMHYPRIPRARWEHDLKMARAMGLNTITIYTFWNAHEAVKGQYDFSGDNDVAGFVRAAQKEGLYVILRPGPYVCAEWEWGGFPAWFGSTVGAKLRTNDPAYVVPVRQWLKRLAQELAPLQAANGGPIIAVQIENEYGSYGHDVEYMRAMRKALVDAGFDKTFLYSTDGGAEMAKDHMPEVFSAVNFGAGKSITDDAGVSPRRSIAYAQKIQPGKPVMVGEYWDGWFDHWGAKWIRTDAKVQSAEVEWMLKQGYGISIYMFVGGTSFGWMNGANSNGENYEPDVTSYDYDSVLKETGEPSEKYFLFRDAIQRVTGVAPPAVPDSPKLVAMPAAKFTSAASLWKTLPAPHHSEHPLTMEELGQAYGYVLYRTHIGGPAKGTLELDDLHQYADVYANGKRIGTMDRRLKQKSIMIDLEAPSTQLDILVENTGRINFGPRITNERIGILGDVHLAGKVLTGWDIYSLPMKSPQTLPFSASGCEGPCFQRAAWKVAAPADTYLDTRELGKGMVWVNGRALGRFWNIGPQGSLYVPASWLHAGSNDVVIFDLDAKPGRSVRGIPELVTDFPVGLQ